MAYDFNGTTGRIDFRSMPNLGPPYSIACWFNADVNNVAQGLVSITNVTAGRNAHLSLSATGELLAQPRTTDNAVSTSTISTGVWYHGLAVFEGSSSTNTSRTVYLNGGSSADNTTSVPFMDGISAVNIGSRMTGTGTRSNFFNGRVAEVAVWNAALSGADAVALATGVSPRLIRPNNLHFYAPLIRERIDLIENIPNTTAGSPAVDIHTRRFG